MKRRVMKQCVCTIAVVIGFVMGGCAAFTLAEAGTTSRAGDRGGLPDHRISSSHIDSFKKGSLIPQVVIAGVERAPNREDLEDGFQRFVSLLEDEEPVSATSPNFGFSNLGYLTGFSVANDTPGQQRIYIEVAYSMLDSVVLAARSSVTGAVSTFVTGDRRVFSSRPILHPNFVFPLTLDPGEELTLLVSIESTSSLQFPIYIWSQAGLTHAAQSDAVFVGVLAGFILVLALYNLLLFTSLRDRSYLYLACILASYVFVELILTGYAYFYVWPQMPSLQDRGLTVFSNFGLAFLCFFSRDFLSLKHVYPSLDKVLKVYGYLSLGLCVASIFIPYRPMILITAMSVGLAPLLCYSAGFILFLRRYRPALFYTVAFFVFVISAVMFSLGKMGFVPRNLATEYAIHVGASLSVLLLSFALADRIKYERSQRESAQRSALANLEKYRKIYHNALEGMLRVDISGRLLACNPAFVKLMGANSEMDLLTSENNISEYIPKESAALSRLTRMLQQQGRVLGFEARCQRIDGSEFWASIHATYLRDSDAGRLIDASIVDITDRKHSEEQLSYIATHDTLTGISNRAGFERALEEALDQCHLEDKCEHALMLMDLDQFKIVNDTCGHAAGDELLKQLAQMFRRHVRDVDALGRLGGDEFVILLHSCPLARAREIADRLREEVTEYRFVWNERVFSVGVSVGIVSIDKRIGSPGDALSLADTACYAAKDAGRNRVVVHEERGTDIVERQSEMQLAGLLREAIARDELCLFKQKIVDLNAGPDEEIYEVLVRLPMNGDFMLPGAFLPALDRFHHIDQLDFWVVEQFFSYLKHDSEARKRLRRANINLSGKTLNHEDFHRKLAELFERYEVPKEKVCFEITESEAILNLSQASTVLSAMVEKGFVFALDDFGSGFSSFSSLKLLPVSGLKIDGSFIRDINKDVSDAAMVNAIVQVAHTMGVSVTAEYVEDAAVLDHVKRLGVDFAQGFHLHRPEPLIDKSGKGND